MTTGALEPMRPDPRVAGPGPSSLPPRTKGAGTPKELRFQFIPRSSGAPMAKPWEGPLDLQFSRSALGSHL
jgi:hypothetical protein